MVNLLEKSYWRRQREDLICILKADQVRLLTRLRNLIITEEEQNALTEMSNLMQQIRDTTNSKKKKAELALKRWKDEHSGARWTLAENKIKESGEIQEKLKVAENDLRCALDVSSDVEARIRVLEELGFLTPLEDGSYAHTKDSLTVKGVLATELNEADSLVLSQFYWNEKARSLEPRELLALLSAFMLEGKKEEPSIEELDVPQTVKDGLYEFSEIWYDLRAMEKTKNAKASEWKMCLSWIGPMWRWMEGDSVSQICADYGIYEGNLIRSVLKLQNMLEEWRAMAEYCEHLDILQKFRYTHELLVREAVIQDSLYLHL